MTTATGSRLQGQDDIVVQAPPELMWRLITDSHELPNWGPPVRKVEVMVEDGQTERLGTARRVHAEFGGKSGYFLEHRVAHVPGRKIGYVIDEENFGLARVLSRPGFSLELDPLGDNATRVTFSFFHDPRGLAGRLINPLIKLQQRRNRREALNSLRRYAEELAPHRVR